jgi:hypothetical protein
MFSDEKWRSRKPQYLSPQGISIKPGWLFLTVFLGYRSVS